MTCIRFKPIYDRFAFHGISFAGNNGDGTGVNIRWFRARSPQPSFYKTVYNIYYSNIKNDIFKEGVKAVILDQEQLEVKIPNLIPGKLYYFIVRASLHEIERSTLTALPDGPVGKIYPESLLLEDISADDMLIPISDISLYPGKGVIKIGFELIFYSSIDIPNNTLIVAERGAYGTEPRAHTTDGYDGYIEHDPVVAYFKGFEEDNLSIIAEEHRFEGSASFTEEDGYKNIENLLTQNHDLTDEIHKDFLRFDFNSYRRNSPADILAGKCLGSYIGGEYFCADSTDGVGRMIRGVSIVDINNQRQELLLETTGEPVILLRRQYEGIPNSSVNSTKEAHRYRHPGGFGTEFKAGFEQFFNTARRNDTRILIRVGPTQEDIEQDEQGRENMFIPNCWTMVYPQLKDRDVIVRFDEDGVEEFRYEVLNVTRNKIVLNTYGVQMFSMRRLRKTHEVYKFPVFKDIGQIPQKITTGIGSVPGHILPHTHQVLINENIIHPAQINQVTTTEQMHSHQIIDGIVQSAFGHTHTLII